MLQFCATVGLAVFDGYQSEGRWFDRSIEKRELDNMNCSSYTFEQMAWDIETTEEYDAWFLEQGENEQEAIRMKVELLAE